MSKHQPEVHKAGYIALPLGHNQADRNLLGTSRSSFVIGYATSAEG
jgi:hypothetical protein